MKHQHELIDYYDFEPSQSKPGTKKTKASADIDLSKSELAEYESAVDNFDFPADI